MRQSREYFEETLARGLAFEHGHAIDILHKIYPDHYIINNQVDPTESTGGNLVGPRLYKGETEKKNTFRPTLLYLTLTAVLFGLMLNSRERHIHIKGVSIFQSTERNSRNIVHFRDLC